MRPADYRHFRIMNRIYENILEVSPVKKELPCLEAIRVRVCIYVINTIIYLLNVGKNGNKAIENIHHTKANW